ncbi:MAG: serine/threonine-protein kinase [Chloroflexota bacterium]
MAMTNQLRTGARIEQYRLETLLGRGTSGEVWKASDSNRTVAIKFMNETLIHSPAAAKHRARMEREIDAMRSLTHPNIPELYDYDLDAVPPYLVMRYIGAPSFETLMRSGVLFQLSLEKRLDLIEQLGQGLQALHEKGIIHRDLKPDNLVGTETPYVLDFSVSLPMSQADMTSSGVGTPLYTEMQFIPDKLGDIYSFALICYQMLFKQHPIFPDRSELVDCTPIKLCLMAQERLKNDRWVHPSQQSLANIPAELARQSLEPVDVVFARALGDRQRRYETVLEFVQDLHRSLGLPMQDSTNMGDFRQESTRNPVIQSEIATHPDPAREERHTEAPVFEVGAERRELFQLMALVGVGVLLVGFSILRLVALLSAT